MKFVFSLDFLRSFLRYSLLFVIFIIFPILYTSVVVVDPRYQVLVIQFGKIVRNLQDPGFYFKIPIIQDAVKIEKRILGVQSESGEIIAADQKRFLVDSYMKYRIVDPMKFYRTVKSEAGLRYRLASVIESNVREIMGTFSLTELLNDKRNEAMKEISLSLKKTVDIFGIEAVDLRVTSIDLPVNNREAIFKRMIAERNKEAQEIRSEGLKLSTEIKVSSDRDARVILAEAKKSAAEIRGKGDADAAETYREAASSDQNFFMFLRYMEKYSIAFSDKSKFIMSMNDEFLKLFKRGDVK